MNVWYSASDAASFGNPEIPVTKNTSPNQDSEYPGISTDMRFITYGSRQPLTSGGSTPSSTNIWVYDSNSDQTISITRNSNSNLNSLSLGISGFEPYSMIPVDSGGGIPIAE